jgi:hypothetical protein
VLSTPQKTPTLQGHLFSSNNPPHKGHLWTVSVLFATEIAVRRPAPPGTHRAPLPPGLCSVRPRHPRGGGSRTTTKRTSIAYSARKIGPRQLRKSSPVSTRNVRSTRPLPCPLTQLSHIDLPANHPIVFCHGLLGFDSVTIGPAIAPLEVTHWRGIKEVLQANGNQVLMTRVPATSSPIERARVLEQKIEEVYAGRSVHLIGTSPLPRSSFALTPVQVTAW